LIATVNSKNVFGPSSLSVHYTWRLLMTKYSKVNKDLIKPSLLHRMCFWADYFVTASHRTILHEKKEKENYFTNSAAHILIKIIQGN
jgi:hypothetical protein